MSEDTNERIQTATRIYRQIQALARTDYGGNTNALLVVYALEGCQRRLVTARITTTLDFSFGDLHRSTVIELPELLGTGTIRLASYPP